MQDEATGWQLDATTDKSHGTDRQMDSGIAVEWEREARGLAEDDPVAQERRARGERPGTRGETA